MADWTDDAIAAVEAGQIVVIEAPGRFPITVTPGSPALDDLRLACAVRRRIDKDFAAKVEAAEPEVKRMSERQGAWGTAWGQVFRAAQHAATLPRR